MPLTRPDGLIVATPVLLELHVPPLVASATVKVAPGHTLVIPVIAGRADTVPLTAMLTALERPAPVKATLPEKLPVVTELRRTYMRMMPKLTPVYGIVVELVHVALSVDTWKPAGAVAVRVPPEVRFTACTLKPCPAELLHTCVVNAGSDVADDCSVGGTLKLTATIPVNPVPPVRLAVMLEICFIAFAALIASTLRYNIGLVPPDSQVLPVRFTLPMFV